MTDGNFCAMERFRKRPSPLSIAVTILFGWLGAFAHLSTQVSAAEAAEPRKVVSFSNEVVPILTKAGCNAGPCHAKAGGGQNGFQLSLFGYEPQEDYEHLVKEARGRRLFPGVPERSLILLKATGQLPHGGGVRIEVDSDEFLTIRDWIEQGMPASQPDESELLSIVVEPRKSTVTFHGQEQLKVLAAFSDGTVRDVTRLAMFEPNDSSMAEVTGDGLVTVGDTPGQAAIMIRFQDKVTVYSALVPLGVPLTDVPTSRNFIDEAVFANLREIGLPPSPVCDDATFLRRVTLDIAGRLPTVAEAESFLSDERPDKRDRLIDDLLLGVDYADYFANKWTTLLKNRRDDASDIESNFAFHSWIRDSLLENKPFDQFVRELLGATGTIIENPPVAWYKRVKEPNQQMEDVAQLFLGVRMQCAQCHHHPFERWSQNDYFGLVAFFSRIGRKPTAVRGEDLIFHQRGVAEAHNMRSGERIPPSALGDIIPPIPADDDPRLQLADWMADPNNPYFAKALVNRYWKHFLKRGLIEPEDDIRDSNPPSNPELLAGLEQHFIGSGFDLRELIRVITQSHTYQLSAMPNEHNAADLQNFSHYYPKRMQAEVLLDSIDQLTGATTTFANLPPGTRAISLPDNSYNRASPFLAVFGRPENTSVCECERVQSSSLAQSLHMLNSPDIKSKLATAGGRAERLASSERSVEENLHELYLAAYARPPQSEELQTALDFLAEITADSAGNPDATRTLLREGYEDLLWALMNTKEFLFNH